MQNKLNLGCGKKSLKGYINIDKEHFPGVDKVVDLNKFPYPFKEDFFDEIFAHGVIELLDDFIKVMEELWRISKNKAIIKIESPAFPNPCSVQDPLTKKFMTYNTFEYFNNKGGLDYYSKARFKTLERKYIFSLNPKLRWLSYLVNISPKFYTRFLFNIFPSNYISYKLQVTK